MIKAVIYIPVGLHNDYWLAVECRDHLAHRGYEFAGIFRTMAGIRAAFAQGATLVVVSRQSHWEPGAGYPVEILIDDGETVRLRPAVLRRQEATVHLAKRWGQRPANDRFVSGQLSADRVRELLDGPGEVTVPMGLDPETIAAARRIARGLRRGSPG